MARTKWILSGAFAALVVCFMIAMAAPMVQADWEPAYIGVDLELCPRRGIQCPMVYDLVICDNGVTYPNGCFAYIACAENCFPGNDS